MYVKLGYSMVSWENGVQKPFVWDTEKVPHMLVSGITGGSKTVSAQMMVNQLLDYGVDISICDFKAGGDWDNIISAYKLKSRIFCTRYSRRF